MAANMKTVKETKPKVKEYASVQDYFDDVITKTYDIIKNDALKGKDKAKRWDANKVIGSSKISYYDTFRYEVGGHVKMTIDTPAAYVRVLVNIPKLWHAHEPNTELIVTRQKLTNLCGVKELEFYKEIEGALKNGLKKYESARVAYYT